MRQQNCLFGLILKDESIQLDAEDRAEFGACFARYITAGYIALQIKGKTVLLHRAVMKEPDGLVDHKNGIVTDCRKDNLRVATKSQNAINAGKHSNNTSGHRGVSFNGKHWRARIMHNGKMHSIGSFGTLESAAAAYKKKAVELFGEFAHTADESN
ncbi:HNH endonuclease [Edaphovirga cremea]|uniref:HNH endonuclease n=1 Tax=Edaphovirga cremea TaxID=2267246 RepID=UPI00398A0EA0